MITASIHGRLGADPVERATSNGKTMVTASLAVNAARQGTDEDPEWFSLVAFGRTADALVRHAKGDLVAAMGQLYRRHYTDRDGQQRQSWSLTAESILSALRVRPGFAPALMLLGEFYEIRGRGDAAIEQYRVAVAAYPEYRLARIKLADSLLRYRRDFAAARPHYLAALAINPAHLPTRWLYARALLVEKDWAAAAEQCRIMLERGPSPPASWGLGKALAGSGRPGDALPHLLTAVRSMPQNVPLLTLLARLRAASFDDAVRDVAEALQYGSLAAGFSQGADARALDALAMALASAGRFAGALEVASQAAHRAATNGDADLRDEIRARRELYQQDRPYREVPPR